MAASGIGDRATRLGARAVVAARTFDVPADAYARFMGGYSEKLAVELADYLANRLETLRPPEARAARILRDLVKNQRFG